MKPYFQTDTITLYHGDCRDLLPGPPSESVDVLLTDPPYGMAYEAKGRSGAAIRADGSRQGMRVFRQALTAAGPALKPDVHAFVFCHWASWPDFFDAASSHLRVKGALMWWKARGGMGDCAASFAPDYEVILHATGSKRRRLAGKRHGAVLSGYPPVPNAKRTHPTEKPVNLLAYLLERACPKGGLVLDPFAGSGATLVAAQQLGLRAVGVELEERYCEAAAHRLEAGTALARAA
ncbi:DNA-methyltransferase [Corallococcus exiguus]|uniref:Methyltransferase n=1 Tax=Corallococcus exiguus TaxID=83462 RepID=A0A7X4Y7P1_9BACT|nr:site-specific DNA-methyltransferase [Corallococcus exiguus]NBC40449.1 site-specific DNA-methyltransferase [Corallococcus exiguus]TNV64067.1 site-specific DNA-methyltransferase [Corallococcus exiguus]